MNNTTLVNRTIIPVQQMPVFIDYSARAFCLFVHSVYFILVLSQQELRKLSLIHMHHTNILGLITGLTYCIWIPWTLPNTGNKQLDSILCSFSELLWALIKFTRSYSIAVLAVYRLIAVYRVNLFKKIVKNIKLYVLSILMVWLVSSAVFFIGKYSSNTGPGPIYCIDGSSPVFINTLIYYVVISLLGFFLPASVVITAYVLIQKKLNSMETKLGAARSTGRTETLSEATESAMNSSLSTLTHHRKRKEKKLAKQLIIINLLELSTCVCYVLIVSTNVITIFSNQYFFVRQILRLAILILQSFIPVASLVFNPAFKRIRIF